MFVTLGKDNPVVVAIHSESGVRTDATREGALNEGSPCGPSYRGHVFKKIDMQWPLLPSYMTQLHVLFLYK